LSVHYAKHTMHMHYSSLPQLALAFTCIASFKGPVYMCIYFYWLHYRSNRNL